MKHVSPTDKKKTPAAMPPDPTFHVTVIKIRQPDGSLLVKPGRPEIVAPEVSVTDFSKATGVSSRHIESLCEQGFIPHRRLTPKNNSKILIPQDEISRFLHLGDECSSPSGRLSGVFARANPAARPADALYPGAANGGSQLKRPSPPPKS
jgi:hypothetical protein